MKTTIKNLLTIPVLILLISSCDEVIEPNLTEAEPRTVIEGLVTNQPGPYQVKVTRTNSFYSQEAPPAVENATVIISDNAGTTDTLTYRGEGVYETNTLQGQVGNTYNLQVITPNQTFEASSPLLPVTKIDSIYLNYYEETDFAHEEGYYLAFDAKEPSETEDFYFLQFYKDGELMHESDDIVIANDEGITDDIVGLEGPFVYSYGDTAKVELYSITENAYNFYASLNNNLNNDGGFFSSPPANPPSNITNGALGFFQVSAVETAEIVVK